MYPGLNTDLTLFTSHLAHIWLPTLCNHTRQLIVGVPAYVSFLRLASLSGVFWEEASWTISPEGCQELRWGKLSKRV